MRRLNALGAICFFVGHRWRPDCHSRGCRSCPNVCTRCGREAVGVRP